MLKTTTMLATAILLSTTPMLANAETSGNANAAVTVKTLPKDGANVSLEGVVHSVSNAKEFTLRDMSGETIEVELEEEVTLNKGDTVSVKGQVESEYMGLSKEIDATSIRIVERADNMASVDTSKSTGNFMNDTKNATTGAIAGAGSALSNAADSTVDATKDAAQAVRNMASDASDWRGSEYSTVDALPETGQVMISATVASVSDDMKRFVIQDSTGETIDVHSAASVNLRTGDKVRVKGEMRDEAAGLGEEISAYEVSVNR